MSEIQLEKQVSKLEKDKIELASKLEKAKSSAKIATQKAKSSANAFRVEFRKSLNTAIVAAFSLLIALVWKDLITVYVNKISQSSPIQGQLFTTVLITFICVIGILITTKILSIEEMKS